MTKRENERLLAWVLRKVLSRDGILFTCGMGGIAHETFIAKEPREALLLLFGAMIGVIPFLRLDDLLSSRGSRGRNGDKDG
jgi:hypothetical protein